MKEKINIGYVGLGCRGLGMFKTIFTDMPDVVISAVCDIDKEHINKAIEVCREKGRPEPFATTDYKEILKMDEVDAVIFMNGWSGRTEMAINTMRSGKYAAIEVGCADDVKECFDLVAAYEETGVPVMMLENCCYGRREMAVLNMVKLGLFGEVAHCTGGYHHYLNSEDIFREVEKGKPAHYRLAQYMNKNRESYPTHELGPIAKVLGINRGNRMVSLTSHASKAVGLKAYAMEHPELGEEYVNAEYKQGDIVTTVITCAGGETIMITLDTTLPRAYYSRNFSVRGTKGMSSEERRLVFLEEHAIAKKNDPTITYASFEGNENAVFEKYEHPLHAEYLKAGVKEGHGGMDWLVVRAFVESVKRQVNTPIDAYDTAAWMSIGPLSEISINGGGIPVEIPDFTNGKWQDREPIVEGKYCLDKVCVDDETAIIM